MGSCRKDKPHGLQEAAVDCDSDLKHKQYPVEFQRFPIPLEYPLAPAGLGIADIEHVDVLVNSYLAQFLDVVQSLFFEQLLAGQHVFC